jgi:hypothetical protein
MLTLRRRSLLVGMAAAGMTGPGALAALGAGQDASRGSSRLSHGKKSPWVRNTRGKILYIGDDDRERGREWFSFSYREDGQVTLRAYCEIDDGRVERDVVQTMNSRYEPLDCFVRLHVGGKFLGTGWIRVSDNEAECEVFSAALGRVRQVVPLTTPPNSLVSHPLSSDSLLMAAFDHGKPERIQRWRGGLSTSPLLDGASGPLISVGGERGVEFIAAEKVTTAAGTFDTHHYRLLMPPRADGTPRSYDIWCTHPDYVFVRGEVRGYLRNTTGFGYYELVELDA